MKKLLVALPFVATASWAGTTLYSGSQTRTAYDELVAQLDRSTTLAVSAESYEAGFTESRAVTRVRLSDSPDAEVLFRLHHEIEHSPVGLADGGARVGAARIVTTLVTDALDDEVRDVLASFEGGEPFVLESDVGFGGAVAHAFRVARFERAGGGGGTLRFEGAEYTLEGDAEGRLAGRRRESARPCWSFPTAATRIAIAPGTDRFELDWLRGGRVHRRAAPGARHGSRSPRRAWTIELGGVTLDSSSAKNGERLDGEARFAIGSIESPMPLPLDAGLARRRGRRHRSRRSRHLPRRHRRADGDRRGRTPRPTRWLGERSARCTVR